VNGDINGDRNAFNDLAPGTMWNQYRLPFQSSFDPRVARRFSFGGSRQLHIIWEAFNLTNRPNYTAVDNTLYAASGATLVPNPLFHRGGKVRDPSLFTFAVVGGVPWQDLATDESLAGQPLQYRTAAELASSGRWPLILGNPSSNIPPTDPFMREAIGERSGQNPITQDQVEPSSSTDPEANSINGHEHASVANNDLQYACTFELPEPVVCDQATLEADRGCDCFADDLATNRSVCNPPGGGEPSITQFYGKAYPALRELDVAHQLGRRTVLGSVCAPNTQDETRTDYGYRPVFGALGQRIAATLVKQ